MRLREKALVALMCSGGLRRSEAVALDLGDVAPGLGLRRVQGKGGVETAVPLPEVAQRVLNEYVPVGRATAAAVELLFVSRFKTKGGRVVEGRMKGHRVWKIAEKWTVEVIRGLGHATMEELVYNSSGQLLSGTFMDYAMPTAARVPSVELLVHEAAAHSNPLGVKGAVNRARRESAPRSPTRWPARSATAPRVSCP